MIQFSVLIFFNHNQPISVIHMHHPRNRSIIRVQRQQWMHWIMTFIMLIWHQMYFKVKLLFNQQHRRHRPARTNKIFDWKCANSCSISSLLFSNKKSVLWTLFESDFFTNIFSFSNLARLYCPSSSSSSSSSVFFLSSNIALYVSDISLLLLFFLLSLVYFYVFNRGIKKSQKIYLNSTASKDCFLCIFSVLNREEVAVLLFFY